MRGRLAHKGWALLAFAAICAFMFSPAKAAEQWKLTPLPYLTDGGMSVPFGINNDGQVIGSSYGSSLRTFIYQDGEISNLPNQSSFDIYARSINDAGQIVGFGYPSGFHQSSQAVIWSNSEARNLGALATGAASSATDINSSGQIVGYSNNSYYTSQTHAVIWGTSGIVDLGALSGGSNSYANAINDSGSVVGYSSGGQISGTRATLWQNGQITDLTFGSNSDSEANDINAAGQIVGKANGRAALWVQNTNVDLGTLNGDTQSVAKSINSQGWIVGYSDGASNASGDERATLWRDGHITDLNSLDAVLESGWKLYSATQVNDAGQIIGMGISPNNFYQGFLLSPVPEPSTFGFMLLGLVAVFGATRQSKAARAFGSACALYLLLGTAHAQGSVYRCTTVEGKVSYQAQPCAGAGTAQGKEIPLSRRTPPSNPEVRSQPSRPEPRVLEPQNTKPEAKRWGAEADVMVVSGYEFSAPVTQVHITHSARPVLLVLTSYEQTEWKVLPAPGTRIKAIVVGSSGGRRSNVKAPPQVPIVFDELPYAYETGNIKFRELIGILNARYGAERVLGYRGGYKLPEVVPVSGPFLPDPNLTLDGVRPEVPRVRFSFDLISVDGRRLAWTNTGPKDGKRYTGIVRGGTMSSLRSGPAAVRENGSEAYYLEGNGGTLVWAPKGFAGPTQKVVLPANLPELSWGSGMAWNTRKEVLAIVSFGGEGYFYRYDTRTRQWLGARSLRNRDLYSLALNAETGGYVAISDRAELVTFNERGEMEEVQPLDKLLPDLDSTYDKGNSRLDSLTVAANGNAVAVVNVRNGTVTHIWTYEQGSRKAQLTYKVVP